MIEVRVEYYNKLMGTKFKIRNYVGFDIRKSASETYEYINGLIACAEAIKYGYLKLK